MTATNGAAERLLLFVEDELQPQFKSSGGYRDWQEAARRFFTNTFDAERRAVVERIRERLADNHNLLGAEFYRLDQIDAILDEVAK